jgi:hypothetical protein
MGKDKVTIRLPEDLLTWIDAEAAKHRGSNRSREIAIAIQQRRISMLPKWKREALYAKLGIKRVGEPEAAAAADVPEDELPLESADERGPGGEE